MPVEPQSGVNFAIEKLLSLDALEHLWRGLEARSFFTSWDWIGSWLHTLPKQFEPQLIRATRDGKTVGLAVGTFRRSQRHGIVRTTQLHLNATGDPAFDTVTIEYNDFVGEAGLLPAFVKWFSRSGVADELVMHGILPDSAPRIPRLLRSVREAPGFANDALAVIARDGMAATLSRNARQQLNRNLRDLSQVGPLGVEEAGDLATRLVWFDAFKELHIRSWSRRGKRHAFSERYFEMFHRALVCTDGVQLLRIRAGERMLGYLYNFRFGDTVHAYQSGFDDEEGADRPGYVSHALAIEHCAKQGVARYDFLAGDNRLKHSFGPAQYTLCWATYSRPSIPLRLEAAARWLRGKLRKE